MAPKQYIEATYVIRVNSKMIPLGFDTYDEAEKHAKEVVVAPSVITVSISEMLPHGPKILKIFNSDEIKPSILNGRVTPDLASYEKVIVYFSGGKDSLACLLHLFERGVPAEKIELWHHEIDGREGSQLMDWMCTPDYCRKVAEAFNIPIYFSWKVGGFEREMMRENTLTAPTRFETPEGEVRQIGGTRGKANTRLKFPQVSANLSVRWCSAYLKIDIGAAAIRNQTRFNNSRTMVISGERAEESAARSKYAEFEPDRTDNRDGRNARHVDRWRPIHKWSEAEIWAIIERWKVNPHPAYHLGWGRVSCQFCIFGSSDQWASCQAISPRRFEEIEVYEGIFDSTIKAPKPIKQKVPGTKQYKTIGYHPGETVADRAAKGTPYEMDPAMIAIANAASYNEPVIVEDWTLPAGAFGESCGPI
jgi:3'-phosphoadenosine 5'-phosphosulfate sulfotransferase (PAPS reductase)/FAD synthetase